MRKYIFILPSLIFLWCTSFLCIDPMCMYQLCNFPSLWRISFNVSCKASPVVTNSLSLFCLRKYLFLFFWRIIILNAEFQGLVCFLLFPFLFLNNLTTPCRSHLACVDSDAKCTVIPIVLSTSSTSKWFFLTLVYLKIFSLSFWSLHIICLGVSFSFFMISFFLFLFYY